MISYADYNSMYPTVMLQEMPTDIYAVRDKPVNLDFYAKRWLGIVECRVRIPESTYLPPLPYRHEGKLKFITGEYSGVWCMPELLCLKRCGGEILQQHKSIWFDGSPLFKDYVNYWYQYRIKCERCRQTKSDCTFCGYQLAMDKVAKLMLNALYGKFGMKEDREQFWFYPQPEDYAEHEITQMEGMPDGFCTEKIKVTPPYVIPYIASWVTSLARAKLWNKGMDFLEAGNRLYYCDTDCWVSDAKIRNSFELGGLKAEILSEAEFVAPKLYFVRYAKTGKEDVKAKGFGSFGRKNSLTREEFDKLVKRREKLEVRRMVKLREGLRTKKFPRMIIQQKGLNFGKRKSRPLDQKRIHLDNGETIPEAVYA